MKDFLQKQLLINYLLGICTEREREAVEKWLEEDGKNSSLLLQVAKELGDENGFPLPKKSEVKKEIMRKVAMHTHPANIHHYRSPARPAFFTRRSFWAKIAAVLLVGFLAGAIGMYISEEEPPEIYAEPVFKQTTLSNGQTATLQFGDGTVVTLNGGSTLRYPETFEPGKREIYLNGEAFFDVARDETRPFIVHTENMKTRVLGTSFNLKAYDEEDEFQIAIAEGKVAVFRPDAEDGMSENSPDAILLEENQWLTYHSHGEILEKGEGNIRELIAWKDRILLFRNMPFRDVAAKLQRWYGVEVRIENPDLQNVILEGEHLDVSLEEVLKSLQFVIDFEFELNENYVKIY